MVADVRDSSTADNANYLIDGHDFEDMKDAIDQPVSLPKIVIARTVKGKGVSFMESTVDWHYWPLSDELYQKAIMEISAL